MVLIYYHQQYLKLEEIPPQLPPEKLMQLFALPVPNPNPNIQELSNTAISYTHSSHVTELGFINQSAASSILGRDDQKKKKKTRPPDSHPGRQKSCSRLGTGRRWGVYLVFQAQTAYCFSFFFSLSITSYKSGDGSGNPLRPVPTRPALSSSLAFN